MTTEQLSDFFTAGGTLPPDAPSYVKRSTDDELFRHLIAGKFCYVLTPRQMGKSSLMIRTAKRLSNEGVKSAIVDLTQIGTAESEDQWYKGILTQIKRRLRLTIDPVSWWEYRQDIPNIQKFIEFFEEALSEIKEHVVIFMDEIDTTLKLDFRDNFFAGIRAIFNARAENPDLRRITFVLLGVASPSDLIKDRNRTPFNIGEEIPLRPFNREDARMLEPGLEDVYPKFGPKILDRIFYWTSGHPYLTQKLCQSVVENRLESFSDLEIDLLVEKLFISEEASRETNLQFVRDNILNYPERRVILSLYKKLLRGFEIRDNKNSLPQNHLKLSGLARVEDGRLITSNKIYSKVFDLRWVSKYTEIDWRYIIISILGLIVVTFAFVFYNDGVRLPNQAATRISGVPIYRDDRGIRHLADLFRMRPYIFPNEYEYKAKDTFFNTFSSWEDQKELIEITYGEPHPSPEDYKIVIGGLYTSLADVDNSGQTTKLLEVMYESLKEMGMQHEVICQEIGYWLEGRKNASTDNFQAALGNYTNAINLNPQNPATLFERARIYTRLKDYQTALKDYEQVIAIVPESNIEPTEISTSISSVETITTSLTSTSPISSTLSPTRTIVSTRSSLTPGGPGLATGLVTLTPSFQSTTTSAITSTPTPTIMPILLPIQPRFLTSGQRLAAVKSDLNQQPSLTLLLSQAKPEDYPNLATILPIVTSTLASTELHLTSVSSFSGKATITFSQQPITLSPLYQTQWFSSITTEFWLKSLWSFDPDNNPIPEIAAEIPTTENGGMSEDGLTLTVKLRNDVTWSDGEPVTAKDFVFTYQMYMADANIVGSRYPYADYVESVEAPDDHTVVVKFKQPLAEWLTQLFRYGVLPEHVLRPVFNADGTLDNAEWNNAPTVGVGPFVFKEWVTDSHITFEANPNWIKPPRLQQIIIQMTDDAAQEVAILAGDTDIGIFLDWSQADAINNSGKAKFVTQPSGYDEGWYLNFDPATTHPAMLDVNVRKAIVLATDREKIVKDILEGLTTVPVTFWDSTPPYGNPDLTPYPYNPEEAKRLLDEAGWKDSNGDGARDKNGKELVLRYITNQRKLRKDVQAMVQQMWAEVGIGSELVNYGDNYFNGYADGGPQATGQYDIAEYSNAGAYPGPELSSYWLCSQIVSADNPDGGNWQGYCNPDLDILLDQQATETNPEARKQIYYQIEQIMHDDVVWVGLWKDPDLWSVSNRLQNVRLSGATPFWNAHEWTISE